MTSEIEWYLSKTEDLARRLNTDLEKGLSHEEARARLAAFGPNELVSGKRTSALLIFARQFANVLLLILLIATAISAFIGEVIDAIVISVIVVFVVLLGFIQEFRAERALEALKKMLSATITVLRDGTEMELPTKDIVPGDVVLLEAGDKVPADMRLVQTVNLQVDEAPLTGESCPVDKSPAALKAKVALGDCTNMAYLGTTVTYGKGKAVVVATGMATEFGKIAETLGTVEVEQTPLERRMGEIGRKLGIIALIVIAGLTLGELAEEYFVEGAINVGFVMQILMFSIALGVAAVPEALPAIVTANLAIGMRMMAKRNALIRKMHAVETLGSTQVICTDKTGTLTKGEMTVRRLHCGGKDFEVTGVGYEPKGEVLMHGKPVSEDERPLLEKIYRAVILCNDSRLILEGDRWKVIGDPTEGALIVLSQKIGPHWSDPRVEYPRCGEIPFSSERKLMTTVHLGPEEARLAISKGAPEVLLARCAFILEDGSTRELQEGDRKRILAANDEMASGGLRVLGIAERILPQGVDVADHIKVESELTFLGLIGMIDPPRREALEAVKVAQAVGMRTVMITGDHKLTALAVAKEMGILKYGDLVLSGEELERLGDDEFEKIVERVAVYARVSPHHKLRIVEAWKKVGRVVSMTGDGVNDAPALKRSDIGVAMGITGTEVAKEASHMVLADDNFATIVTAIEYGRWIYDNIKKYLAFLLQANLVEIAVLVFGFLFVTRFMGAEGEDIFPLLAVQILYINLATDGLPAIALSFSPPDPDLMVRPPRPKNEPVFTSEVKLFLVRALAIEAPILTAGFMSALPDVEHARSRLFLMFIAVELVVAISCRSLKFPITKARPHKWLLITVAWETLLIIIIILIPVMREALSILMPTVTDIAWIVAGGIAVLVSMEGLKMLLIRWRAPSVPSAVRLSDAR